jgi:hypothetical protein
MTLLYDYEWDYEPMKFVEDSYIRYMDFLHEVAYGEVEDYTTESGEPFCGCEVCYAREAMAFLMPKFLNLYLAGAIRQVPKQHINKEDLHDVPEMQDRWGEEL